MTDAATQAQIEAADPHRSAWLSANAGSGKTRVLTNRVARLLLRGTDPRNILCLTYTKAAASEMQNRLFKTLGGWAMLDDAALRKALTELGETPPDDLAAARTLFARAIEVPGGLRIQTIHALCASILRQFPLEGGVSPLFRELDEGGQSELIEDVLEDLALNHADCLGDVSAFYSEDSLVSLGRNVAGRADDFAVGRSRSEIFQEFGVPDSLSLDQIVVAALTVEDLGFLRSFAELLRISAKPSDHKLADALSALRGTPALDHIKRLEGPLLYTGGAKAPYAAKIGAIPTKDVRALADIAPMMPRFEAIMVRIEEARQRRIAFEAASRAAALHRFARAFLPAYDAAKLARGVLDFDDLIRRTRDMLSGPGLSWVLFRLDGRIEHILVDEAQDTSPAQWQIVQALTDAMADDPDRTRTLFVVGDKKQSIYSFQGADADGFDDKERVFDARLAGQLGSRKLLHSFRSSPAVLSVVDQVAKNLDGLGDEVLHHAFYSEMPGRVDLLPLIPRPDTMDEPAWNDPVDRPVDNAPVVILGQDIARHIDHLLKNETIPGENGTSRPVAARDIMILVQRRSAVFDQVIQACKALKLPIAGSDRLRIGAELAVRDLLALLAFLDLPEDDLSLAAALRSPLFGWSEEELYDLAANRAPNLPLWAELRRRGEAFPETVGMLDDLRRQVDFRRPFELLEHILGRFDGRKRLLARLGAEAEDGIDELLNQAIVFEQENVPTLTGFLSRARSEDVEIKRNADASADLIRVMTVHGAKGLERPIVILPDTTGTGRARSGGLLISDKGMPVIATPSDESPEMIQNAREKQRLADESERNRLLYVAMTRAESWLIVGGIAPAQQDSTGINWHQTIEGAMRELGAGSGGLDPDGLRLEYGDWPGGAGERPARHEPAAAEVVPFLSEAARKAAVRPTPLSPSDLGGAKVLGGGAFDEDRAMRRGRQLHLLLEHLPGQSDIEGTARRLLSFGSDRAEPAEIPELLNQAMRCLTMHPGLFVPGTLAEVDVAAHLPTLDHPIAGKIDRLVIGEDSVLAVDFKTNAIVPDRPEATPEGLLRQMGAYLEALELVYPKRRIEVAILWTETCDFMVLPHDIVRKALENHTIS